MLANFRARDRGFGHSFIDEQRLLKMPLEALSCLVFQEETSHAELPARISRVGTDSQVEPKRGTAIGNFCKQRQHLRPVRFVACPARNSSELFRHSCARELRRELLFLQSPRP